jgi:hypothetical protein
MTGAERIAAERARQVSEEGYDAAHDDEHNGGEIAMAAACYAAPELIYVRDDRANQVNFTDPWPWHPRYDARPHDGNVVTPEHATRAERIRLLEKAGALVAAEIDRLLRAPADDNEDIARAALTSSPGAGEGSK